MAKPNLMLIGAPKCGTTSLHAILGQHPGIFVNPVKEPKFFSLAAGFISFNGPGDGVVRSKLFEFEDDYLALFNAGSDKQYRCDASADNLYYHERTIPLIREKLGQPKIVIMLRDPVSRAYSAYDHLVREFREAMSFSDALRLEESRKESGYEFIWHYRSCGRYANSVKAFMSRFRDVHVIILEEFFSNFTREMERLCEFLGMPVRDFELQHENSSLSVRNLALHYYMYGENGGASRLASLRPRNLSRRVVEWLNSLNYYKRDLAASPLAATLAAEFRKDVLELEEVLGRRLNDLWLSRYST